MIPPGIYFVGDDALAAVQPERGRRHALARFLRQAASWRDVVPGKGEVTVHFNPLEIAPSEAVRLLAAQIANMPNAEEVTTEEIQLHMRADAASAPDLARLAAENSLSPEDFLARVTASDLLVDMMGFTAGFAYVAGVDPALTAPRLDVPRQKVPAGSVGFISGQLGLYALAGPAGWPVIGCIREPLFDASRPNPFLLDAGMRVRLIVER